MLREDWYYRLNKDSDHPVPLHRLISLCRALLEWLRIWVFFRPFTKVLNRQCELNAGSSKSLQGTRIPRHTFSSGSSFSIGVYRLLYTGVNGFSKALFNHRCHCALAWITWQINKILLWKLIEDSKKGNGIGIKFLKVHFFFRSVTVWCGKPKCFIKPTFYVFRV